MNNGFIEKSESERRAEFEKIMKANDKNAAFRWLREETLIKARETIKDFLPCLNTEFGVPLDSIEALKIVITALIEELEKAPFNESQVPIIPFPIIKN